MNKVYNHLGWLLILFSLAAILAACSPTPANQTPSTMPASTLLPANTSTTTPLLDGTPTRYVELTCEPVLPQNPPPTQDGSVQWTLDASTGIYHPRIPIPKDYDSNSREMREAVMKRLLTLWFERQKTSSDSPRDAIRDYKLGNISQTEPSGDPAPEIAASVELWIIPSEIPNNYASFPGETPENLCSWWHIFGAPFGVYRDHGYFWLGSWAAPTP